MRPSGLAPYALVMAAGTGSRFGGDKLLAPLRARPLAEHVAATVAGAVAAGVLAGGLAVVPVGAAALAGIFEASGLVIRFNPRPEDGLSRSLRTGLGALGELPAAGAALVLLADQPLVRVEVIVALVAEWRRTGRSARPRYGAAPDVPGHPVLLDRSLWAAATGLTGDAGFGALFRGRADLVTLIDVAGANPDVDSPADLTTLDDGP